MNYMLIHPPLPANKSPERVAGRDGRGLTLSVHNVFDESTEYL